jgi:hypothetical protein
VLRVRNDEWQRDSRAVLDVILEICRLRSS